MQQLSSRLVRKRRDLFGLRKDLRRSERNFTRILEFLSFHFYYSVFTETNQTRLRTPSQLKNEAFIENGEYGWIQGRWVDWREFGELC